MNSDMSRIELNEEILSRDYNFSTMKSENSFLELCHYLRKKYAPNKKNFINFLHGLFPLIETLPKYNFKEYFLKDLVSGLTIGVLLVPMTMAYSLIASLPAYQGLYTIPLAMLTYFIFGNSIYVAIGTFAAVNFILKKETDQFEGVLFSSEGKYSTSYISNDPTKARIMISACISFYIGIIQIIFGLIRFGSFFAKYLSDVIVSAYTSAIAFLILITEVFNLLGISKKIENTQFFGIQMIKTLFSNLHKTNLASLIISCVCMLIIFLGKLINYKLKNKKKIIIPIEFLTLLFATLFSYIWSFSKRWDVKILGPIPLGYPDFQFPKVQYFSMLILPAFNISIVAYAINISVGKLYAKKTDFLPKFKPNHEAFAYGLGNIFVSFFSGIPSCSGLSRCAVLESTGVKTNVYMLFCSGIVLVFIFWIGKFLEFLPEATLASIISVSLLNFSRELGQIGGIYKRSKAEGVAFCITWLAVVILHVDLGLYAAMLVSLLLIIFQSQRAIATLMGNIPKTDIYEAIDYCDNAKEIKGIKIIRFEASLYYANIDRFESLLKKLSGVDPGLYIREIWAKRKHFAKLQKIRAKNQKTGIINRIFRESISKWNEEELAEDNLNSEIEQIKNKIPIKHIIVDLSCVNRIDSQSLNALIRLNDDYKLIDVNLYFSFAKRSIIRVFNKFNFKDNFDYKRIFPTTQDAVLSILTNTSIKIVDMDSVNTTLNEESNNSIIIPMLVDKEASPNPIDVMINQNNA